MKRTTRPTTGPLSVPEARARADRVLRVALVGCAKTKRPTAARAQDLYVSDLFSRARRYAETFDRWYVLSAAHGLLRPDDVIEPYDVQLSKGTAAARRESWARRVAAQLERELAAHTAAGGRVHVVFLAGVQYRRPLATYCAVAPWSAGVSEPLAHLGIGEQKAWLHVQTHADDAKQCASTATRHHAVYG